MVRASIDLGTNTCLLLVVDWDSARKKINRVIGDHTTLVRLGEGVDKRRELQPQAMERTYQCLERYSRIVKEAGTTPDQVVCVATSQARDAKNSSSFFEKIQKNLGFSFRTLSGQEEARSTFRGALLPGIDPANAWVIDIGGGSTEIISLNQGESADIGSVRFTERFLKSDPVTDEEFWECQEAVDQELGVFLPMKSQVQSPKLVAVAGTATTLAAWHLGLDAFDAAKIDEAILSRGDIHRMVEELKWRTIEERKKLPGMEPKRADVLLAGALILWRAMEVLQIPECRISTRGLRYGILLQ